MSSHRNHWTGWFNADRPWKGDGDHETVANIERHYGKVCEKNYDITEVECKINGVENSVFDHGTPLDDSSDVFKQYCTLDGLICKNRDQPLQGKICNDYSVRFYCTYYGEQGDNYFPQFDVRIYIILAVVPILIFLARILWAYVFRRRRQRRRNERRARRRLNRGSSSGDDNDDDTSSIASGLANPPPSYQEIFGKNSGRASVFTICRDNIPVCSKCQATPCSVSIAVSKQNSSGDSTNEQTQHRSQAAGGEQPTAEQAAGADTSKDNSTAAELQAGDLGSVPADVTAVQPEDVAISTGADNSASAFTEIDLGEATTTPTNETQGASPAHQSVVQIDNEQEIQSQLNNSSEANDASRSSAASRVQKSLSPTPLSVSPFYFQPGSNISQPCACPCHRTIPSRQDGVEAYDNPGYTSDAEDGAADRRVSRPGMHVPVPGLRRVWSNLSSASVVTLTELPSYEDALELMKKKKEKELESQQNAS